MERGCAVVNHPIVRSSLSPSTLARGAGARLLHRSFRPPLARSPPFRPDLKTVMTPIIADCLPGMPKRLFRLPRVLLILVTCPLHKVLGGGLAPTQPLSSVRQDCLHFIPQVHPQSAQVEVEAAQTHCPCRVSTVRHGTHCVLASLQVKPNGMRQVRPLAQQQRVQHSGGVTCPLQGA